MTEAIGAVGAHYIKTQGNWEFSESGVTNVVHELYDLNINAAKQFGSGMVGYLDGLIALSKHNSRLTNPNPEIRSMAEMRKEILSSILDEVGLGEAIEHMLNAMAEHPYDALGRYLMNMSLVTATMYNVPIKGSAKIATGLVVGLGLNTYVGYGNALLALDKGINSPKDILGSMHVGNMPYEE